MSRILIAGGGIGGLSAAIALAQAGASVRVFERAQALGEVGAGITLSPNACKALYALGLKDALEGFATEVNDQGLYDYKTGDLIDRNDRAEGVMEQKYGAPYLQCHRADLHAALVDRLSELTPAAIELGRSVQNVKTNDTGVTLSFAGGTTVEGDGLIGADGMRSHVRAALFGPDAPRYTGRVAYRAMIPADALKGVDLPSRVGVAIGPNRSFAYYPVRQGRFVNVVALGRTGQAADEDWGAQAPVEEVLAAYDGWHDRYRAIIQSAPGGRMMKWGLFDRPPMTAWSRGPVTLLGDAAHPALPYMGMGAALAIEDAVVLGRCVTDTPSLRDAFARYEAARLPRATLVQRESALKADRWEADDGSESRARTGQNEETLGLFSYDARSAEI